MSAELKGRIRQADRICAWLREWAPTRADLVGVAVVGSYARQQLRLSSDLDVVLMSTAPESYTEDIVASIPLESGAELIRSETWGPVTEHRMRLRSGFVVEFGITSPVWASIPLDPGTRRVLGDGSLILFDPHGILAAANHSLTGS